MFLHHLQVRACVEEISVSAAVALGEETPSRLTSRRSHNPSKSVHLKIFYASKKYSLCRFVSRSIKN